jgi:hypothetical protein
MFRDLSSGIYRPINFPKWPPGFHGYESWLDWFCGYKSQDRARAEGRRYREASLDYQLLDPFWKLMAQTIIIKPLQVRLLTGFVLALFGSKWWACAVYGKRGIPYAFHHALHIPNGPNDEPTLPNGSMNNDQQDR